jgi:hypothetical protein
MNRAWPLLLVFAACETREVPVFDVPVGTPGAGAGGTNGGSGGAGAGGMPLVVSGGAGSGGAGSSSGGGGSGGTQSDVYGGGGSYETGGSGGGELVPCQSNADCDSGLVCDLRGCDAPIGFCKNAIFFCSDELKPVCGCDGITYWNDCVRVNPGNGTEGAVLAGQGQCSSNVCPCDVGGDCEVPGASCSHLLPAGQMCGHGPGSCWVLPPTGTDKKLWRECRPPDQGGLGPCVSTYEAIISEHSHVEARRDDPCN